MPLRENRSAATRRQYAWGAVDVSAELAPAGQPVTAPLALVAVGCLLALLAVHGGAPGVTVSSPVQTANENAAQPAAIALPGPQPVPLLVTKDRPLDPLTYNPPGLVKVDDVRLSAPAAKDFAAMVRAAAADGVPIRAASGYRSYAEQDALHARYLEMFGPARAAELSAEPGHSEHQTGLAVDIADPGGECALADCFARTPAGAWAAVNAWRYGFIVRYPAGGQEVTGYSYEPWHLRHVGVGTAAEMHRTSAATLEAYLRSQERPTAR